MNKQYCLTWCLINIVFAIALSTVDGVSLFPNLILALSFGAIGLFRD